MVWLKSEHSVREKAVGFLHLAGVVRMVSGMPEVPGGPRGTARTEPPAPPPLRDGVQVRLRSAAAAPGPGQGPETSERPRLCLPAARIPSAALRVFREPTDISGQTQKLDSWV